MPDLRCNRSYKINFCHPWSWIAINLCRRQQWKILIRKKWELNTAKPPTPETALQKRNPSALDWKLKKGSSARCGSAERPSSAAHSCSCASAFSECVCLPCAMEQDSPHALLNSCWCQVKRLCQTALALDINPLFWQEVARINTSDN